MADTWAEDADQGTTAVSTVPAVATRRAVPGVEGVAEEVTEEAVVEAGPGKTKTGKD